MEHKGLIYTLSGIAVLAVMIALIAFGLDSGGSRNFVLDSFPSGANVYLNGKPAGKTPLLLDADFMRRNKISGYEEAPLLRIFTPNKNGSLLISSGAPKNSQKPLASTFTFALPTKHGGIPQVFEKLS